MRRIFVCYSWGLRPFTLWSDDPALDGVVSIGNGRYYSTESEGWRFRYQSWDGSLWDGSCTIHVDEPEVDEFESGRPVADGVRAGELSVELLCLSAGPTLYLRGRPFPRCTDDGVIPTAGRGRSGRWG